MAQVKKLKVRTDQVTLYMKAAGITTNRELARRMGTVTESTVSRMRNGLTFNEEIIEGLFNAFPRMDFADLFERVAVEDTTDTDENEPAEDAA